MNQIETAQYIIDEFTEIKQKVVDVTTPKSSLLAMIHLDNGMMFKVVGKFASDIKGATDSQKPAKDKE